MAFFLASAAEVSTSTCPTSGLVPAQVLDVRGLETGALASMREVEVDAVDAEIG